MTDDIRLSLAALISKWRDKEISEQELHETCEEMWESQEWEELPEKDSRSIPIEVLMQLDILNSQLIVREDVPAILKFLETPVGLEKESWHEWRKYWDSIDFEDREKQLRTHPFYGKFIGKK